MITNIQGIQPARAEYNDVQASVDATLPTYFTFPIPVPATPGQQYALAVAYDGNEDFVTWKDVTGDVIIGSNTVSSGPSGNFSGDYYTYISPVPTTNATSSSSTNSSGIVSSNTSATLQTIADPSYTSTAWRASSGTSLKFSVACARYAVSGNNDLTDYLLSISPAIATNTAITTPAGNYVENLSTGTTSYNEVIQACEYIVYDRRYSSYQDVRVGERIWQWKPYIGKATPLTATVISGVNQITTTGFNWNDYFSIGSSAPYIVLVSENHDGPGLDRAVIRQVRSISNTAITVDQIVPWSNATCYFYKTVVGQCQQVAPTDAFGSREDIVILNSSSANAQIRFTNNCIESLTVANSGIGYSNTDYVVVSGYEYIANVVVGGSNCYANIVTDSTGAVVSVRVTDTGCGFVNTASMVTTVLTSNGTVSNGSGLIVANTIGSTMISEFDWNGQKGFFKNCRLVNLEISSVEVSDFSLNPLGSFYNMSHRLNFFATPNTSCFSGIAYYKDAVDSDNDIYTVKPDVTINPTFKKNRVDMSWSNEVLIDAMIVSTGTSSVTPNCSAVIVTTTSNNDFVCSTVFDGTVTFSKYLINNDYTGENTNYGNAQCKGITSQISLANNAFAEDVLISITAYRPVGTDIKVLAKLYNTNDSDSFDQKDWTLLQCTSGGNTYSSQTDYTDTLELQFGLPAHPNTAFVLAGSATTTSGNTTLTGYGTTWSSNATANLHPGDLVRISQPLFPNNQMICLVSTVTDGSITVDTPVTNNGVIGSGLIVEKIAYPNQAFLYNINDNIVRYYNSTGSYYDTYDTIQMKIVLLAQNEQSTPYVDDVRASFVSA